MTDIINITALSAYPGVKIRSQASADLVLELTNGLISDILGDLSPIPTQAKAIALKVASRALENPEGAESITTGIDDWKKTIRYRSSEMADEVGVYLSDAQRDTLLAMLNVDVPRRRVKSIGLRVPGYANGC